MHDLLIRWLTLHNSFFHYFYPKVNDTKTNDAIADFLENNLQNFIRDCNANVVFKCDDSQDRDPGKSLGCFMS